MSDVAVVGVGMARFGRFPEVSYLNHGVVAIRNALADAGLDWTDIESFVCGAGNLGMSPGSRIGHELGLTGAPIVNIENASASGTSAFREAYLAVAHEECDIALAVGVGKMQRRMFTGDGTEDLERRSRRAAGPSSAAGIFALRARRRMHLYGTDPSVFAQIAVKSHRHAALNPYAQFQTEVTLEQVLASRMIADPLHLMECCPTGDGGAAAIVATPRVAERLGRHPVVRVVASASKSELFTEDPFPEWVLTKATALAAYEEAAVGPEDLDLVQVHDAFSSEEIEYYEALGICPPGEGERLVRTGDTELGGRIPFNTDGGLISRGHPIGPTGLAQIWETVLQLRGDAGPRQVDGARTGLTQMIGAGTVCMIHILQR